MERLKFISDTNLVLFIAAASASVLAGAHLFENFAGLPPCALCLRQREAYWIAIPLLLGVIALWKWSTTSKSLLPLFILTCAMLALLWGTALAGYHAGVEQKWWAGPQSCTGIAVPSIEDMLKDTAPKVVRCDEIPWSFLGISLAGYNFLIAMGLSILCLVPMIRFRERN